MRITEVKVDQAVPVVTRLPVFGIINLLFYNDGTNDEYDGKCELQYHQHFTRSQ